MLSRKSWMPFTPMPSWAPPVTSALRITNSGSFKRNEKVSETFHAHLQGTLPAWTSFCFWDQTYLAWTKNLSQSIIAATEEDQKVRVCAEHLRQYNEGLNLSNTIRMCDSFSFLNKFYEEEMKKKTTPDDEEKIQITNTERFLFNLFKGISLTCCCNSKMFLTSLCYQYCNM